jgi:hypothetical protein
MMDMLLFLFSFSTSIIIFYFVKTYLLRVSVPLVWLGFCFAWGIVFWPIRLWLSPQFEDFESILRFLLPFAETILKLIPLIFLVSTRRITSYREGILYGLAVGLSISFVNNLEFVLASDLSAVQKILRMNSLESVHAVSTGMMGFALSMGRGRRTLLDRLSPLIGIIVAVVWQLAFINLIFIVPEGNVFLVSLIFVVGGAATMITVIKTSQLSIEKKRANDLLDVVIPIGVELSSEKAFGRLLERMTVEAISYCHADAGILYLRTDDDCLKPVTLRHERKEISLGGTTDRPIPIAPIPLFHNGRPASQNIAAAYTAVENQALNLKKNGKSSTYDFSYLEREGFRPTSSLTLPLETSQESTIGVLQLFDARDIETDVIIPFDENLEAMMHSFSSLATAALEAYLREASLRHDYAQLNISIDGSKVKEEVRQIEDSDFFRDLQARAKQLRRDTADD